MPCICQYFTKDEEHKISDTQQHNKVAESIAPQSSDSSVKKISTSEVSASELAFLKAEVWSLKANLEESTTAINNLQKVIKSLVEEKYRLLTELNLTRNGMGEQSFTTRDVRSCSECNLIEKKNFKQEIDRLKELLEERSYLLQKATKQNIELKITVQEANETIHNIGVMYLKLKSRSELQKSKEE